MTLIEVAEAKASDPARCADLENAALDAETGSGSEIVLFDDRCDKFVHVITGQRDFTLGVTGGHYVRGGGKLHRSWFTPELIRCAGWFETRLMDIDASEISFLLVKTPEGQMISRTGSDGSLSINPLFMDVRAHAKNNLSPIVRLIEIFDFTDVRAS